MRSYSASELIDEPYQCEASAALRHASSRSTRRWESSTILRRTQTLDSDASRLRRKIKVRSSTSGGCCAGRVSASSTSSRSTSESTSARRTAGWSRRHGGRRGVGGGPHRLAAARGEGGTARERRPAPGEQCGASSDRRATPPGAEPAGDRGAAERGRTCRESEGAGTGRLSSVCSAMSGGIAARRRD